MQRDDADVERRHRVRSPDEVALDLTVAGPTSRIAAYAVDTILMLVVVVALVVVAFVAGTVGWGTLRTWFARLSELVGEGAELQLAGLFVIVMLAQLLVEVLYFVGWELTWAGQTPGKRLLGLRVVRDGALPLTPWASLVRNVLRAVDQLPTGYVVGLIACIMSEEGKRLGDMAAGTIVTRSGRSALPEPIPTIDDARVDAVHLTSQEVARLDRDVVRLARATLRRLSSLEAERRAEVLELAARAIVDRLERRTSPSDPEAFLHAVIRAFEMHRR